MADLNKVFIIGRLTFDPELRNIPNGSCVCNLRMATNRVWQTKEGEKREEVAFLDVTVWNRQAENCARYLAKGSSVHIEGFLKHETWDDKTTGEKRSKLIVLADRVQFLDSKGDGGRRDDGPEAQTQRAPSRDWGNRNDGHPPRQPAVMTGQRPPSPSGPPPEDDGDIPF
jgi:single-strand DNA-binding protein